MEFVRDCRQGLGKAEPGQAKKAVGTVFLLALPGLFRVKTALGRQSL